MIRILEWLAFGGSLLSVYAYGHSRIYGPRVGMGVAILFITYGFTASIYAAALSNFVFLYLHYRNYRKAKSMDWERIKREIAAGWQKIQDTSHQIAVDSGWWTNLETGERIQRNVGELLCLIHSEVSEAMEGHRKNRMDDKLPHRPQIEVELADAVIRIGDLGGALGLDIGGAIAEKMAFNAIRPDHKIEARKLADGKKY